MNIKNIKNKKNIRGDLDSGIRHGKTIEERFTEKVVDEGKDTKTHGKSVRIHGYTINPKKRYNVVITDYLKVPDVEGDDDTGIVYGKEETYSGKDVIRLLNHYSHKLNHPEFEFGVQEVNY